MLGNVKWSRFRFLLIGGLVMLLALAGCGRNPLGPTAPTLNSTSTASLDSDDNVLSAECTKPGSYWNKGNAVSLIQRLIHRNHVTTLGETLLNVFFTDANVRRTVGNILVSKPFHLVALDWGLGHLLLRDCLRILAYAWFPGLGSSPQGFAPEVTLLPFAWSAAGFDYPNFLSSWHNGDGYQIQSFNPEGVEAIIQTNSRPGNIYANEKDFNLFSWRFRLKYPSGLNDWIEFNLNSWNDRLTLDPSSQITQTPGKVSISFGDVWASTVNKSARCQITDYFGSLNMDLVFAEDGSGGGFVEIALRRNRLVRYELTHFADGHGYWTKDGGKQHRY
jgi:hypothetical protein